MKQVFSSAGLKMLRTSWILLGVAVAASLAIVFGSRWILQRELLESASSVQRVQDARARLDNARRERDSLQESSEVFRTLVERGLLQSERRLDLIELVNALRARHQLVSLDYEIAPQRPLALAGGRVFASVEVLASRVRLKARALHERDVLEFVEALSQSRQGFYPVDRCTLRRLEQPLENSLQPRVEAECTLEWITLKERKGASRAS